MTDTTDWKAAVWAAFRARTLTRSARDVMLTLATFKGPEGRIWPSHALLATRARVCVKTVCRAMAQARAAGLLTWRSIRWLTPGGHWRRKSNLYVLRIPVAEAKCSTVEHSVPAYLPKLGRYSSKGLFGRQGEQGKKKLDGSGGRTVAQQLAVIAVGSVADARAALALVADRMRERQRAALAQ